MRAVGEFAHRLPASRVRHRLLPACEARPRACRTPSLFETRLETGGSEVSGECGQDITHAGGRKRAAAPRGECMRGRAPLSAWRPVGPVTMSMSGSTPTASRSPSSSAPRRRTGGAGRSRARGRILARRAPTEPAPTVARASAGPVPRLARRVDGDRGPTRPSGARNLARAAVPGSDASYLGKRSLVGGNGPRALPPEWRRPCRGTRKTHAAAPSARAVPVPIRAWPVPGSMLVAGEAGRARRGKWSSNGLRHRRRRRHGSAS